jgi:hypothetical protein
MRALKAAEVAATRRRALRAIGGRRRVGEALRADGVVLARGGVVNAQRLKLADGAALLVRREVSAGRQ